MKYLIREMEDKEYPLLKKFLYEAIYVSEGTEPPPVSVLDSPELQVYIRDFGSSVHDRAFAAVVDERLAGAAWARIMEDYGHVDADTPSLAIAVLAEYRGHGIGSALLKELLSDLREYGYQRASLSVQKENTAVKMYKKAGFTVVRENDEEYIMAVWL